MSRSIAVTRTRLDELLAAEAEVARLRKALTDCIETAAELRREISPDKGCGFFVYKRVWDDSFAAENRAKQALAPDPKEPSE